MKIIQLPETVHSDVEPLDEIINVIMPCKFIIYHDAKIFVWWHAVDPATFQNDGAKGRTSKWLRVAIKL